MILFIFLCFCYSEFIQQLVKYQSIKTRQQVLEDAKLVGRTFSEDEMSDLERIGIMADYDMFKIKNGNELIASVSCRKKNYYKKTVFLWREFIEEIPAVEIYSLWVSDKYRGRGIARKLLSKALECIRNEYNYGNDFIVGLHLNSDDGFMNVSFALYYSLHFRKGMFVQYGPDDLRGYYERIHTLHDPVSIILGKAHCTGKGSYFAMYTTYNQILFNNPIANKNLFQIGERLRSILQKRKEIEY